MMSPWDELSYFETPIDQYIILTSQALYTIPADPKRVLLVITSYESVPLVVRPINTPPVGTQTVGLPVANYLRPLIFSQKEHGPLAQIEWHVNNPTTTTTTLYWFGVVMKEWPALSQPIQSGILIYPGNGAGTNESRPREEVS